MKRRTFLSLAAAGVALGGVAPAVLAAGKPARVVVVGGGFAGSACAKYIRRWSPTTEVILVDPSAYFVSCPMSNRVIGGMMSIRDLTRSRNALASGHGVQLVRASVDAIDADARRIRLDDGSTIDYDRLVLAPGIDFMYESMPGLESSAARSAMPHAWRAGDQTRDLRQRVMSLPEGGVFAMHIPPAPYRCPPGTYERACLVANTIKRANKRAKVLIFDANPDIVAKRDLFMAAFRDEYRDIIEYVPNARFESANAAQGSVDFDIQAGIEADVWNIVPPQQASALLRNAGLANVADRWCGVDFLTYESRVASNIHIIGDSIASAPGMPKSGHMANQQAKVCAGAIAALLAGRAPNDEPIIANTCYSFVNEKEAIHIAAVYGYDAQNATMVVVPGSGGLSEAPSSEEGFMAVAWAFNILNDTLS